MLFGNKTFRHIIIAQSRDWFAAAAEDYDPAVDLVLTVDFGLHRQIEERGGAVAYLDHLIDTDTMQANNYLAYEYFQRWHLDERGEDLLRYRDIPFGFALKVDIWNDLLSYVRFRLCLSRVAGIDHSRLRVGTDIPLLLQALEAAGLSFEPLRNPAGPRSVAYFFPIFQWMDERVRNTRWKVTLREWVTAFLGTLRSWVDRLPGSRHLVNVYVQEYHPTRKLAEHLRSDPRIRVVQGHYRAAAGWRGLFKEHVIPVWPLSRLFSKEAERLLTSLAARACTQLRLKDGTDITKEVRTLILSRLHPRLAHALNELHWVKRYLERHPLALLVLVGNIGPVATMVHRVAECAGTPSFLIINGFLGKPFIDEGRYATWINAFGESIRDHYFKGMDNVLCLGDPRMDDYADCSPRILNREHPTITVGASGFNPTDLNSYLAVEFDFLCDILRACREIVAGGRKINVIIKVRSNGYRAQYESFVAEYFPDLPCRIEDAVPMRAVLEQTDFYISIYSQTLFEASCLGIPAVYYRKDTEISDPPFDGASELVTVDSPDGLVKAFADFSSSSARFDAFLSRNVMAKYIGNLDGLSLQRTWVDINNRLWGGDAKTD